MKSTVVFLSFLALLLVSCKKETQVPSSQKLKFYKAPDIVRDTIIIIDKRL